MSFFVDFATAMSNYLQDSTTVTITDVSPADGGTGAINVNEVWRFKVSIANNGNLNMTNVKVWVAGLNGALVGPLMTGPWFPSYLPASGISVNAHGTQRTGYFYLKAPATASTTPVKLVTAHVCIYDATLDHIMVGHSDHTSPPVGEYSSPVYPS